VFAFVSLIIFGNSEATKGGVLGPGMPGRCRLAKEVICKKNDPKATSVCILIYSALETAVFTRTTTTALAMAFFWSPARFLDVLTETAATKRTGLAA
jgi:hypothetical protein